MLFFKPYPYHEQIMLGNAPLLVHYSRKADRAIKGLENALRIEMRLYFSCVLKKMVMIDTLPAGDDFTPAGNNRIFIKFSRVAPPVCDPDDFAREYPVERHLDGENASKIHPRALYIDYRKGQWEAHYEF